MIRLLLRIAATIGMTWLLATFLPQYVVVTGGIRGIVVVGIILALLNAVLRIVFDIVLFPLRLFSKIVFLIMVNAGLLWFAQHVVDLFSESIARFHVQGGFVGWVVAAVAFGVLSWLIRELLSEGDNKNDSSAAADL